MNLEEEIKRRVRGPSKGQGPSSGNSAGTEAWGAWRSGSLGGAGVRLREAGPHRHLRHLGGAKERFGGERLMQLTQKIPSGSGAKAGERCLVGPA